MPQSRERLIFIGVRDDLTIEPSHPKPQTTPPDGRSVVPELAGRRFLSWRNKDRLDNLRRPGAVPVAISRKGIDLDGRNVYADPAGVRLFFGYPPTFQMAGTASQQLHRLGNSVPPKLMQAVAAHVRAEVLERIEVMI